MSRVWSRPTTREIRDGAQVEICALCGRLASTDELIEGTAQGLAGKYVCNHHFGFATNPSFQDLQAAGGSMLPEKEDLDPHSGDNWCIDRDATFEPAVTYLAFGIPTTPNYTYSFAADFDALSFPVRAGDLMRCEEDALGVVECTVVSVSINPGEMTILATSDALAGVWMSNPTLFFTRVYPS